MVLLPRYPASIPPTTLVPIWAFLNISKSGDTFDLAAARQVAQQDNTPDGTSVSTNQLPQTSALQPQTTSTGIPPASTIVVQSSGGRTSRLYLIPVAVVSSVVGMILVPIIFHTGRQVWRRVRSTPDPKQTLQSSSMNDPEKNDKTQARELPIRAEETSTSSQAALVPVQEGREEAPDIQEVVRNPCRYRRQVWAIHSHC